MMHSLRYLRAAVLLLTITAFLSAAVAGPFDPPATYYDTATGTGATLKSQLHDIIDNHSFFSYGQAREILQITDVDPNDPDRMLLVYNRVSLDVSAINPGGPIPGWDSGASWNREHTWPRSRGINSSGDDNSDLHQLRPSDPGVNSSRSKKNFGGAFGQQAFGAVTDGGAKWYPGDADAGMIARQEFYVAVRYDGSDTNTLDLELLSGDPNPTGTSASDPNHRFLGDLDRLLEWHYQAVPDDFELRRNDVIHDTYQGNRIPFVDRPEFVWSVFVDQLNDSQLYVGGAPAGDGSSTLGVALGPVIVGGAVPAAQNVTLNKNGFDGSYYEVTTTGLATSSVTGRFNAFAISAVSTDSTTLSVGLSASTATAGQQSGSVVIDNLDVTTGGGAGRGANDANDTINVTLDVLDHAEASFAGASSLSSVLLDFGTVTLGSTLPTLDFDVFNLVGTASFTADLELDSFPGTGDTGVLTTDLATFTGGSALAAGLSNMFTATLDTSIPGAYSATYTLSFSDEDLPGATALADLTLNLIGTVDSFLAADFNGDGSVNSLDLTQWEGDYGLNADSDADFDGDSDGNDFLIWQQQNGQSSPLVAASQAVPEPSAALLLALGLALVQFRRSNVPRRAGSSPSPETVGGDATAR